MPHPSEPVTTMAGFYTVADLDAVTEALREVDSLPFPYQARMRAAIAKLARCLTNGKQLASSTQPGPQP